MGVEPKIKLNLKALSSKSDKKTTTYSSSQEEFKMKEMQSDIPQKGEISEKTNKEAISDISIDKISQQKKDEKSHHISFADIKKQIEKKNSSNTQKVEDTLQNKEENPSLQEKGKNISGENTFEDTTDTNSNLEAIFTNKENKKQENNESENKIIQTKVIEEKSQEDTFPKEINEQASYKQDEQKTDSQKDKIALENVEKTKAIIREKEEKTAEKKKGFFSKFLREKGKNKKDENIKDSNKKDISDVSDENSVQKVNVEENITSKKEVSSEVKVVEKIHFSNYESHFKKESTNFLKKFQNFKYTPSTRVGMILGLISVTIIGISALMILFPEKHSLEIYKASILEITGNTTETSYIDTKPAESNIDESPAGGKDVKDISKVGETEFDIKIKETSKEKLRQHLLNKYK